jgi:hypothetical protein
MGDHEDDLLWRLRNPLWSHGITGPVQLDKEATIDDLSQVAAEIERLRAPVQGLCDRESIARVVDPRAFEMHEHCATNLTTSAVERAFEKADAILGLRAPEAADAGAVAEPFGWIIGSVEKKVAGRVFFDKAEADEHYGNTKGILYEWVKVEPIYASTADAWMRERLLVLIIPALKQAASGGAMGLADHELHEIAQDLAAEIAASSVTRHERKGTDQ